jgi:phosphopentomutase
VGYAASDAELTQNALDYLATGEADFTFIYMGEPDAAGHGFGWMGDEYKAAVKRCWANIDRIRAALGDDYTIIVTADHGGHGRSHGCDIPEDMTIPILLEGSAFAKETALDSINIKDLAPTVATLLGVAPDAEWEGKSLI